MLRALRLRIRDLKPHFDVSRRHDHVTVGVVYCPNLATPDAILRKHVPTGDAGRDNLPAFFSAILASRALAKSPTLCALLIYLWNNRDEEISEYAIATEALGRAEDFDSKIDATVRVQISRLRQRLEKYYREEGGDCAERISIPLGGHTIEVHSGIATAEPIEAPDEPVSRLRSVPFLRACCGILLAAVLVLSVVALRPGAPRSPAPVPAPRFWRDFFAGNRPAQIVLPTPVFYSWTPPGRGHDAIKFRDTDVNRFEDKPKEVLELERRFGPAKPAQNYTVTTDAFAAIQLVRYLDRGGFQTAVWSSSNAEMAELSKNNVIALGTWGTLTELRPYLDRMSFELGPHETYVLNRKPAKGEPERFDFVNGSYPGVVAVLPGAVNRTRLLLIASRFTAGVVSLLTSRNALNQIDELWKGQGSPEYYEVVVTTETNSDGEEYGRGRVLALHSFPGPAATTAGARY
jgi:hypothetical protein